MKEGDLVKYTVASDDQVSFGSGDDPRPILVEGDTYEVSTVDVHSWHTLISLVGVDGVFNSVCFEEL